MTARTDKMGTEEALADTSLFVAVEQDRPLSGRPPKRVAISVITIGELRLGVLAADSGPIRARRLETLRVTEPAKRQAGEKVGSVDELVGKLKALGVVQ